MNIESTPAQYGSVFGEACFAITGIEDEQCDVQIIRYDTGKTLGVKRFRGVQSCRVNAAPYMRTELDIRPMNDFFTGLYTSGRTVSCAVACGDTMSEAVLLTAAAVETATGKLLSDIASVRSIGHGDWDELSFIAPFSIVEMNILMYGAQASANVNISEDQLGADIIAAVVCTDDIAEMFSQQTGKQPDELEEFTVEIYADYVPVTSVNYRVEPSANGMRLGWVNRYGCMDYFSFPVVCSRSLSVEKSRILSGEGYRTIGINAEESAVVSSGYRPKDEIRALAAILSSPAVWRSEQGVLDRMDITTGQVECMRYGEPTEIRITLRPAQKTAAQIIR